MADRTVSVALQLKIQGFTSSLRTAQQQVSKFADDTSTKVRKNKAHVDELARGLGGVGLAAGAGLGLAIKRFADFDKAMSNVRAATHETAGNMALLREAALDAGARTAFSATEAAAAIENLAKAGVSTSDILRGGLNGALALAAAGEINVGDAAEIAATAMTQFHLAGKDVPHIADLLAAGAGKAQGEVSDLSMALKQSGLVASQFGLSVEDTTGTLAAFASAGLLGSDAGTSFKTMLLQLANPSAQAADTMRQLGINAYDAQGAFVGIAPLAEQLHTKLAKLTQEQRDSALATIFGSDAIRAANVLYTQGSKGITDWTTKVNDAGYAAETAAAKQDNLAGDVEKLGGAFDTALIKGGSGANAALRALVQTADDAITGFTKLPPAVSGITTGLLAVATIGGLGSAGILKAVSAVGQLRASFLALGKTAKIATLSMGAVGVALTAAVAIYGAFAKQNEDAEAKADNLRSTLDEATGAITKNTRAYVANQLATSGVLQTAKDLGLSLPLITDAALGNKDAMDQVNTAIDAVMATQVDEQGAASDQAKAAGKLRVELDGLNGTLTDAQRTQRLTTEATKANTTAQKNLATVMPQVKDTVKAAKDATDAYINSLLSMPGITLSVRDAQRSVESAIDAATKSIKENGRTLDIHTEKGRNNQAALDEIADRTNKLTEVYAKNGYSQKVMTANVNEGRAALIKAGIAMGMGRKAAEVYAAGVLAIPDKKTLTIEQNAAKAGLSVDAYNAKVAQIAKEKKTRIEAQKADQERGKVEAYRFQLGLLPPAVHTGVDAPGVTKATSQVDEFGRTINNLPDKKITITPIIAAAQQARRNKVETQLGRYGGGYAAGGPVFGEGTATSDSIPAMLSHGEHVWTAKEVQKAGGHGAVEEMRRSVLRFAAGGAVTARVAPLSGTAAADISDVAVAVAKPIAQTLGNKLAASLAPGIDSGAPGGVQVFRGERLNARTIRMLLAAERMFGHVFHIMQGSYSTRVAASGGTHAGGGAMDTDGPGGWSAAQAALRKAGFAAWHRTPAQGPWGHHIHSIAIGDPTASASAKAQVRDFQRGGDGLGSLGGMAKGGAVDLRQAIRRGVLLRDKGGPIPTGTSIVHNNTGRSEYVLPRFAGGGAVDGTRFSVGGPVVHRAVGASAGRDVLRRGDLHGMRIQLDAPGVGTLTGHIRLTARDEIDAAHEFAATTGRMR